MRATKTTWLLATALALVCIFIGPWAVLKQADTSALTAQDIEALHQFVATLGANGTEFTYDQLKAWFESQTNKSLIFEDYPRLFPFCVTSTQIKNSTRTRADSKIKKFERIMEFLENSVERFYAFNKSKHLTNTSYNKHSWIELINTTRINPPEPDMINLKQWIHLKIRSKISLKGMYIQSIVGPLGLPFGEFFNDFPCADDPTSHNISDVGELVPCTYRPRCTITHPSVYVGYDPKGREDWHTNYFWTDITCMETPYVQFLIIAVKDFDGEPKAGDTHEALLSPVYLNSQFDSRSEAPYPYDPAWKDDMYCNLDNSSLDALYSKLYPKNSPNNPKEINVYPSPHKGADNTFKPINWTVSQTIFRIQPNEVYDKCLTSDVTMAFEGRDSLRLECPPGPFRCATSYGNTSDREVSDQRELLVTNEANVSNCIPCGAPACPDAGFSEDDCHDRVKLPPIQVSNLSTHVETGEQISKGKAHGIASMLAFLVLVPLSNFVARFYKEVCGECLCGNGPWIFFHIASQMISIMIMWLSIGPVSPKLLDYGDAVAQCSGVYGNSSEKYQKCIQQVSFGNPHVPLAIFAFFMQHLLVAFGFLRQGNNKLRNIHVTLHSHFGHACWLIGAISGVIAAVGDVNGCMDPMLFTGMLIFVPLMFYGAGVAIDCISDKMIGVIPPRKQWPVLEPIKLEGRGPCTMPKCILFGAFVAIMMLIWVIALGSYLSVDSVEGTENAADSDKLKQNVTSVFKLGFFGCEIKAEFDPSESK